LACREAKQVRRAVRNADHRNSVAFQSFQERTIWGARAAINDAEPAGYGGLGDAKE
jgi:hypothetical protein